MRKLPVRIIAPTIVAVVLFMTGAYVSSSKSWPYDLVHQVYQFIEGDQEEDTTLLGKIKNDLNIKPDRQLVTHESNSNLTHKSLSIPNLNPRRNQPQLFISEKAETGYRLIYGVFDFEDSLHGAILLNETGQVVQTWKTTEENLPWEHNNPTNVFPHGLEVFSDGSIIFTFDASKSIQKLDACGNLLWSSEGYFHHSVESDGGDHVWTWLGRSLVKLDIETGRVKKHIKLESIMDKNPDIDILGLRQSDSAHGWKWNDDHFHPNDIDPLTEEIAPYFPQFNLGDLLVSIRSINLVFVVNPETLQIKWWRIGQWRRQHDPDWSTDGTFTVFDNDMHRGYSSILKIDPDTYQSKTIVEGENIDFYSSVQGTQQITNNNHVLISISQQGRIIEMNDKGKIVFEFINSYDSKTHENLLVSDTHFLSPDFFEGNPFQACQ